MATCLTKNNIFGTCQPPWAARGHWPAAIATLWTLLPQSSVFLHALETHWLTGTCVLSPILAASASWWQEGTKVRFYFILQHHHQHVTHWVLGDMVVIFKVGSLHTILLWIKFMSISYETALRWMLHDTFNDDIISSGNCLMPSGNKPLPEVNHCWPRSMSPYSITGP